MAIKIYIDQGHNPQNPNAGAEGNGFREQDIVYTIGVMLARSLNNNPNFEAELSRNTQTQILGISNTESLQLRVNAANSWKADFFVSLHTNASVNTTASGSEALVYSKNSAAYTAAEDILYWLNNLTGLTNRGIFERPGLYVLRKTKMPSVLTELGFITNSSDAFLLSSEPDLFASGIYNGILEFYNLL